MNFFPLSLAWVLHFCCLMLFTTWHRCFAKCCKWIVGYE